GCVSPVGRRTTLTTRLTSGSSRHSRSTPRPTIPVAPKTMTFTGRSLVDASRRSGRRRLHRHDEFQPVVGGSARRRRDEQDRLAVRFLGALEPDLDLLAL